MMTGYLLLSGGGRLDLPTLTAWKLRRTGSVPCDSFEGTCLWDGAREPSLEGAYRLILEEDGARRFTGVLDEYRVTWSEEGGELFLSGRGMAALLLGNEAPGQDYQVATLEDILRDHVTPYGVEVAKREGIPAAPGFSVTSGASQWQVLYSFARYHGGVEPRFDVYGRLTVAPGERGGTVTLDHRAGPIEVIWQDKRYGVLSQVLVQDRGQLGTQQVTNEVFQAQGGRCSRVLTMPGKSAYEAMRYSGQFQLDRSYEERFRLEVTLPGSYVCEPGDRVEVALEQFGITGTWRVLETLARLDGSGSRVTLTLGR